MHEKGGHFHFEPVTEGVYALAVWDSSWNSYNDCYVLTDGDESVLVDSQKSEHADILPEALHRLGKRLADVSILAATHGHHDHIGGSRLLPHASKHIHPADWHLLDSSLQQQFKADLPDKGRFLDFDVMLLGQHTAGSVALFHRPSRVLFSGDHICFFGSPISSRGLVSYGSETRDRFRSFVTSWSRNWPPSSDDQAELEADLMKRRPEDQERYNFDLFLSGVKKLQDLEPVALCTGHGGVLLGGVRDFLRDLTQIAERHNG